MVANHPKGSPILSAKFRSEPEQCRSGPHAVQDRLKGERGQPAFRNRTICRGSRANCGQKTRPAAAMVAYPVWGSQERPVSEAGLVSEAIGANRKKKLRLLPEVCFGDAGPGALITRICEYPPGWRVLPKPCYKLTLLRGTS
jgi:hypothetical protein